MWMSVDENELKRMLSERSRKDDPFFRMEHKPKPGKSKVRREIQTPDGETIYVEEREITTNPYSAQQEHTIIQISHRCESCKMPITGEMLALDEIKPCINCHRQTCPRCRVNTNLHEYIRPEIRGQPLCQICWDRHVQSLIVTCPSCKQPVKDSYDIKQCAYCGRKVCPACGVSILGGALLCASCHADREDRREGYEAIDTIFREALEGSY